MMGAPSRVSSMKVSSWSLLRSLSAPTATWAVCAICCWKEIAEQNCLGGRLKRLSKRLRRSHDLLDSAVTWDQVGRWRAASRFGSQLTEASPLSDREVKKKCLSRVMGGPWQVLCVSVKVLIRAELPRTI